MEVNEDLVSNKTTHTEMNTTSNIEYLVENIDQLVHTLNTGTDIQ